MPKKLGTPNPAVEPAVEPASEPVSEPVNVAAVIPQTEPLIVPLDRDDLRRSLTGAGGRSYVWPPNAPANQQTRYISVTTALKALPKEALIYWAAKSVAETAVNKLDTLTVMANDDPEAAIKWLKGAPWSQRDKAANIGTELHLIAEFDAQGNPEQADQIEATLPDEQSRNKARQVRDFISRGLVNIENIEGVVYNDALNYAGTFDFIFTVDNPQMLDSLPFPKPEGRPLRLLADLKTGKGVYPEVALQMAAYRNADWLVDLTTGERGPVPDIDGAVVFHVTEKSWALIPVDTEQEAWFTFTDALQMSKSLPLNDQFVGSASMRGRAKKPATNVVGEPTVTPKRTTLQKHVTR